MIITVLLLTGLALVNARSNGDAVVNNARVYESHEVLVNGCPANFDIEYLLPHEVCEKYYQCDDGEKIERDCQAGTVFNSAIQACDWPLNVPQCEGSPGATAPPPAPDSSVEVSDPNDLDWEALSNGCPADYKIDFLLPHESDCGNYYACDNGELVKMECPAGLHFSQSRQKCTWPEEAGCGNWKSPGSVPVSVIDRIRTANPDCPECPPWPVNPADRCKDGCNVAPWPHPECDKYYFCVGDQFRLGICAEGLHFNPRTLTCDMICNAGCARIIPQITRHADGLLTFVPNAWGNTAEVMDMIERELNAGL